MVNRVETIELAGTDCNEVTNEFEVDVKKKIDEGWKLLSHARYFDGYKYCLMYEMVRLFPYNAV